MKQLSNAFDKSHSKFTVRENSYTVMSHSWVSTTIVPTNYRNAENLFNLHPGLYILIQDGVMFLTCLSVRKFLSVQWMRGIWAVRLVSCWEEAKLLWSKGMWMVMVMMMMMMMIIIIIPMYYPKPSHILVYSYVCNAKWQLYVDI